ncbi:hypothetical protein FRC18_001792 [Serendipita sp. 400]|nr:hypothetical protein FRC18_001792 [Serendipita sp. 400]
MLVPPSTDVGALPRTPTSFNYQRLDDRHRQATMNKEYELPSEKYLYNWTSESGLELAEFLEKYKPALIRNDANNSRPYIWITNLIESKEGVNYEELVKEADAIVKDTTIKVAEIQNNDEIPIRANKKKGLKSKKEVRETIQADGATALKNVAIKHGFVGGKWIVFVDQTQVNSVFGKMAKSLVSGGLSHTSVSSLRVSTVPFADTEEGPVHRHLIEVYFPNVYDEDMAREVMRVLLRDHGLKISGAKPSLYTAVGLDSKHPSGIPSTVWKGSGGDGSLFSVSEVQSLRDAYYKPQDGEQTTGQQQEDDGDSKDTGVSAVGEKTKTAITVKNRQDNNPFGSDDEEAEGTASNPKKADVAARKKKKTDPSSQKRPLSASSSDAEGEPPKKAVKRSSEPKKREPPAHVPKSMLEREK